MISRTSLTSSVMSLVALQYCVGVSIGFIHHKKRTKVSLTQQSFRLCKGVLTRSSVPTSESRWTPGLRDLSVKKHRQADKRQASSSANPGVETKIGRVKTSGKTLCQQHSSDNRGVDSPVTELQKVHRLSCHAPAVLREGKATAVLEPSCPGRNLGQFLPLRATSCLAQWHTATVLVQLQVFLRYKGQSAWCKGHVGPVTDFPHLAKRKSTLNCNEGRGNCSSVTRLKLGAVLYSLM